MEATHGGDTVEATHGGAPPAEAAHSGAPPAIVSGVLYPDGGGIAGDGSGDGNGGIADDGVGIRGGTAGDGAGEGKGISDILCTAIAGIAEPYGAIRL